MSKQTKGNDEYKQARSGMTFMHIKAPHQKNKNKNGNVTFGTFYFIMIGLKKKLQFMHRLVLLQLIINKSDYLR